MSLESETGADPTVGRTVHYVLPDDSPRAGDHRAAIVTGVLDAETVNLCVFLDTLEDLPERNDDFEPFMRVEAAVLDADKGNGTWHWPELT